MASSTSRPLATLSVAPRHAFVTPHSYTLEDLIATANWRDCMGGALKKGRVAGIDVKVHKKSGQGGRSALAA
jgi:hypothetical protein